MADADIDAIGAEASAMMKTMLQLATLVALRTRERGQKEAEIRVKLTQQRVKESQELAARAMRAEKAADPRNAELMRMMERTGVDLNKDHRAMSRELAGVRAERAAAEQELSQVKARAQGERIDSLAFETAATGLLVADVEELAFDSPERREALGQYLEEQGVEPDLIHIRMLGEMAQAKPPIEAARDAIGDEPLSIGLDRELDGLTRIRDMDPRGYGRDI